ncbi:MAG: penicillin-binding protein 2 [Candidatus Kapaibacterium sp.]
MAKNNYIGDNPYFGAASRRNVFKAAALIIGLVFIGRLAFLQLIEGGEYRLVSDDQAIKRIRVEPYRGNMFDRNGELIVHNEPSFSVVITPNEFRRESFPLLTTILDIDTSEIDKILKIYRYYSSFEPIKIYHDASIEQVSLLEEYNDYLPGIDVYVDSKRLYEFDCNMAHMLGYTREISQRQLEFMPYYRPGDIIGQTGLEREYEKFLRGVTGIKYVAVNKFGKKISSFDNGKRDVAAINGFDLSLTIDIRLQEFAEKLLGERRGALVALDPNNGEILAMVSKPDYNPRDFSGKVPAKIYNALRDDPGKPLLDRTIMAAYAPGSTWKMLIGLAGLNEDIINANSTYYCNGGFHFGNRTWNCHGVHGNADLRHSIQGSCNAYFNRLALDLGYDIFTEYGKLFGFGQQTGIDLPNESEGLLPTTEWLTKRYGRHGPSKGRLVNYGIGQGEILTTPLQIAVYTAALANRGKIYQPHLVRYVYNNMINKYEPVEFFEIDLKIPPDKFDEIHKGMYDVVNTPGGTALNARLDSIKVCGKTGTAQNPHGNDHSWFVCFAPMENPKIAIAVIVENAGFGSTVAAPIARDVLRKFFNPDFDKKKPAPPDSLRNETPPMAAPDSTETVITRN